MSPRRSIDVEGIGHGGNPIPFGSRVGPLLCSGGIMGADPTTGKVPSDGPEQVRLAFANMAAFLAAAGGTTDDIARVGVLLADNSLRSNINDEWVKMFPDEGSRPARHTTVRELPNAMVLQLEVTAWIES